MRGGWGLSRRASLTRAGAPPPPGDDLSGRGPAGLPHHELLQVPLRAGVFRAAQHAPTFVLTCAHALLSQEQKAKDAKKTMAASRVEQKELKMR